MRRGKKLIGIILILLFFSSSCRDENQKAVPQFYYFPKKNVYYDPGKKQFLYSLDSGRNWVSYNGDERNANNLGQKILITSNDSNVYNDNEKHIKLYRGQLYNIQKDSAEVVAEPEITEKKESKKRDVFGVKKVTGKKTQNGLGKFIKRIFGKHK